MEKNTLSINCVFLIPWWCLQGVGIGSILGTAALRQHSQTGAQDGLHSAWGNQGPRRCRIVHRDGQCTLSLVWTQRTKERFYCKVWQVLFADSLLLYLLCQSLYLLAALLAQQFHHVCIISHFMTRLLMTGSHQTRSRIFSYVQSLLPISISEFVKIWHKLKSFS